MARLTGRYTFYRGVSNLGTVSKRANQAPKSTASTQHANSDSLLLEGLRDRCEVIQGLNCDRQQELYNNSIKGVTVEKEK